MNAFLIVYLIVGLILGVPLVLTQALHKNPWVRKQVENVYGPAYAMGFLLGLMVLALTMRP